MRLIDPKEGKVLGVNAFDLLILLLILAVSGYYLYTTLAPPPSQVSSYSGLNIQNAVLEYSRLSSLGYVVEARVEGIWTGNKSKFDDDVLITWAYETRLFGWYKGKRITIGGPNAYIEDVAASKITFKTTAPSLIRAYIYPISARSLDELADRLEELSKVLAGEFGVRSIKVRSSIIVDAPGLKPNAYLYSKLKWRLYKEIPWGYPYLYFGDSYITIKFDYTQRAGLTVDDIRVIGKAIEGLGIEYSNVTLEAAYLFIGTERPLTGVNVYPNILENARKVQEQVDVTRVTYIARP